MAAPLCRGSYTNSKAPEQERVPQARSARITIRTRKSCSLPAQRKAAAKEIAEFTGEFLNAARKCFELIDKDGGGTLSTAEIVKAVKEDQEVITFLRTCGEENLQFLLHPPRLKKALEVLDEDGSGEIDIEEWRVLRRP